MVGKESVGEDCERLLLDLNPHMRSMKMRRRGRILVNMKKLGVSNPLGMPKLSRRANG